MILQHLWAIYHPPIPDFIKCMAETPAMQRLKDIGMNCGCEYTSFPLFLGLDKYSRFNHSVGVGLIVWHFTHDVQQAVAALLHDISTPVFAHVIDFMNNDHERQESTESRTTEFITSSEELQACLLHVGLTTADVDDYHRFPIADNDTPRLSADRLEYTMGNIVNYRIGSREDVVRYYDDLVVDVNEDGVDELMFCHSDTALAFGMATLQTSAIYVDDQDRYAMQMLALLVKKHINRLVLTVDDLYTGESQVIQKLMDDEEARTDWLRYRALHTMSPIGNPLSEPIAINAKKRYIDPFVKGEGRLSSISETYRQHLAIFLSQSFDHKIFGE